MPSDVDRQHAQLIKALDVERYGHQEWWRRKQGDEYGVPVVQHPTDPEAPVDLWDDSPEKTAERVARLTELDERGTE